MKITTQESYDMFATRRKVARSEHSEIARNVLSVW